MGITFYLKALKGSDKKRFMNKISAIAKKEQKSKIKIASDMLYCSLRYGAGPLDYELFELCTKTKAQRKTYITRGINNNLVKRYNHPDYRYLLDNKIEFNKFFAPFIKREWIDVDTMSKDSFIEFCRNKECIIYKPTDGCCGKGIEKINLLNENPDDLYKHIKNKRLGLLEEQVIQNSQMSQLYPNSVNTVRLVTLINNGRWTPIFAFLRIGTEKNFVDNLNNGGIAAKLDLTEGKITLPAASKDGTQYTFHPNTEQELIGFCVPHWDKVLALANQASKLIPKVAYVGWDIAIRENDVVLIEGNSYPGHDIFQLPAYTPDGIGLLPNINKLILSK